MKQIILFQIFSIQTHPMSTSIISQNYRSDQGQDQLQVQMCNLPDSYVYFTHGVTLFAHNITYFQQRVTLEQNFVDPHLLLKSRYKMKFGLYNFFLTKS